MSSRPADIRPRSVLLLASLAVLGAPGCGLFGESGTSLADLAPARVEVTASLEAQPRVDLLLHPPSGDCEPISEDVDAKLEDEPMDLFTRGGEQPSKGGWVCSAPRFRRSLSDDDLGAGATRIEASDDTARIVVEIAHLLEERTLVPQSKNDQAKPGDNFAFDWSVPEDELLEDGVSIAFVYEDPAVVMPVELTAALDGDSVILHVPASAPLGKGKLRIDVSARAETVACEGVPACDAHVNASVETEFEIIGNQPF
ncbi:hypothetical protein [Polyangium aurulentum]|uniref:hypothetical protein n=1 Tax=Polyangium aurulentum TaxID=2567896 RepID=UPI0010AE7C7E|nr:hypothetical protein [Polyangium aurulentum]UQA57632.1 hypothetical protein E8A73_041190 [Polyangium aurulentum]